MNEGQCLCGSVKWGLLAQPYAMYNCHCRMCQKVHGAAFGTYCFVRPDELRWLSPLDTIVHYQSSERLVRSSCKRCGSVVPYMSQEASCWVAPGGCHDQLRKPDCNIFVTDQAPWYTLSEYLPVHDGYPEESGALGVAGLPPPAMQGNKITGACLCGAVSFELTEMLTAARHCHCTRCRQGRSAAHASNGFVSYDGLQYTSGEDLLTLYKVPDAQFFTQVFCRVCSSLMPRKDVGRGIAIIPLGSLDTDPGIRPQDHIYVADKAAWHDITDELPQFSQGPS